MKVIPVLDLKAGQAVHAVRGERNRYAPVQGVLGSGEDPVALATAYRDILSCDTCYIADLDAITNTADNTATLKAMLTTGLALWVDAGVAEARQAQALKAIGIAKVIIGSETLPSIEQLKQVCHQIDPHNLVFSLDSRQGVLWAPDGIDTPHQLVTAVAETGIRTIILLDLARVGASAGPPLDLLQTLRPDFPQLAFYAGGGVRHAEDLAALKQADAAGALIATAFHRGTLTAADLS